MTFGFIGTGNMGGALAAAVAKTVSPETLFLANRTPAKAEALAAALGANPASNADIAKKCDYIFLGVKPQMMSQLLAEIAPILASRRTGFVLVSMAAGLSIEKIQCMAGGAYPVIRIMPNTPAKIGEGMILYAAPGVTSEQTGAFRAAMAAAGELDELPEGLMDAGSAVSGCGPAFVYLFIEALADGGVECGLPRQKALLYAAQTVQGAAALVLESHEHPGVLKDAVCSPGGSTIAGVHALEDGGFRAAAINAVVSAWEKTKNLGK